MSRLVIFCLAAAGACLAGCSPSVTVNQQVGTINPSLPACSAIGYSGTYQNTTGEFAYNTETKTATPLQGYTDSGNGYKESSTATLPPGLPSGNYQVEIQQNGNKVDGFTTIWPGPAFSTNSFTVTSIPDPGLSIVADPLNLANPGGTVTLTVSTSGLAPGVNAVIQPDGTTIATNGTTTRTSKPICQSPTTFFVTAKNNSQCPGTESPSTPVTIAQPTITRVSPMQIGPGTQVTITGTGFDVPGTSCEVTLKDGKTKVVDEVDIGPAPATGQFNAQQVTSATTTSITFTVQQCLLAGPHIVRVATTVGAVTFSKSLQGPTAATCNTGND